MTVTPERITTDITVNTSTRVGADVHSVTLSDGSFIVAYVTSDADATAGHEVVAQQFDAIGNKIGGEMILASTTSTDGSLQFDIVALENNQIGFGFENFGDIQVEAFTIANGIATADPALSQTINTPGSTLLDVALSGDSLATLKLHYAERTGTTNTVIEQRDVSGGVFTAQTTFTSSGGDADIEIDSDTLANGNTVFIVDKDGASLNGGNRFVDLVITAPDGTVILNQSITPAQGSNNPQGVSEPRVTALKNGGFVIGITGRDGDSDVTVQVFNDDGTVRSVPRAIFTNGSDENDDPEIVALDDGGFVAFQDRDNGGGALQGRRFDSDGNPVGSAFSFLNGDAPTVFASTTLEDGRFAITNLDTNSATMRIFSAEVPATIDGTANDDTFDGTSGDDTLNGLDGDDRINGEDGNDTIDGGAGDDFLIGGFGDDLFIGGAGADFMNGGTDFDTVSYANSTAGLTVDFTDPSLNTGDAAGDTYTNIEKLVGTAFDDTLNADGGDIEAGDGDDTVFGFGNDAVLNGGEGNDTIDYSLSGNGVIVDLDTGSGFNGLSTDDNLTDIENVIGSADGDNIIGSAGVNIIEAQAGDDIVNGDGGDDILLGEGGNDTVSGGDGDDSVSGGVGNDTLNGDRGEDILDGGIGNDFLSGGRDDDILTGGDGDDRVDGDGGDDSIDAGDGNDTVNGGTGEDLILGGIGIDSLGGGADNDTILGGAGGDSVNGGDGDDLLNGGADGDLITGDDGNDIIDGDEGDDNLFGNSGADDITGGLGDDDIDGGSGNDDISGGEGADSILGGSGDDTISGGDDNDTVDAGSGTDVVDGDLGNDFLRGEEGDDILRGGLGDDNLWGGEDDDLLIGGLGADEVAGGEGIDTADYSGSAAGVEVDLSIAGTTSIPVVNGSGGEAQGDMVYDVENLIGSAFVDDLIGDGEDNRFEGLAGNDDLDGEGGDDMLLGGAGDDRLNGGEGDDTLDGGAGSDTARYADVQSTFSAVDDGNGNALVTDANGDTDLLIGIEFVEFTDGTVAITDLVSGGGITGTPNADTLDGTSGDDLISGLAGNDLLRGLGGDDTLLGGDGDDNLFGGAGADSLDGGAGRDFANYADSATGLRVDLVNAALNTGIAAGDTLANIEVVIGSGGGDDLRGDAADNQLEGRNGNDFLTGREGDDDLRGGNGDDVITGGAGADRHVGGAGIDTASYSDTNVGMVIDLASNGLNTGIAAGDGYNSIENLVGSGGNDDMRGDNDANRIDGRDGDDFIFGRGGDDVLVGGNGDDNLRGGSGGDVLNGGGGIDSANYIDSVGLKADLQNAGVNTGVAAGDSYISVENLFGSNGGDDLRGDAGDNLLLGRNGDDFLTGRDGDDELRGGAGNDVMTGGAGDDLLAGSAGNDTFVFNAPSEGVDTILDFQINTDTIRLNDAGFTALSTGALGAGNFVNGTAALDANDFILYDSVTGALSYDADGNGSGAAVQFATLNNTAAIDEDDFFVI